MFIKKYYTKISDGEMGDIKNRKDFLDNVGLSNKIPVVLDQVHGNKIVIVDDNYTKQKADGMITRRKDVALFTLVADCLPILFFDSKNDVIAVAHAGREGTFQKIVSEMVQKLNEDFNSDPEDLSVEIGPSIGNCCYEVSKEMCSFVEENFGEEFVSDRKIDLKNINKKQLLDSGVKNENIVISDMCTKCGFEEFFSFRRRASRNNFAGVICLN